LPLVEQVAYYKDKCEAIEKLQAENEVLKDQLELVYKSLDVRDLEKEALVEAIKKFKSNPIGRHK